MHLSTSIWVWIAAFFTLAIFSFLYKDNPFYRFAESVFVGSSAAFAFLNLWFFDVKPKLWDPIAKGNILYVIIPLILSVLMLTRFIPKIKWLSRWAIAFTVGMGAGLGITGMIQGYLVPQLKGTFLPLWVPGNLATTVNNWLLVFGTIFTITYFYFSKPIKGKFGIAAKIGIIFIMVAFGASFGYTIMARVSLLIGRVYFLLHTWLGMV